MKSGGWAVFLLGVFLLEAPPGFAQEPVRILTAPRLDPAKTALGKRLFAEPQLSGSATRSCASCHALDKGGADGQRTPLGDKGEKLPLNTPTIFNVALNFRQGWAGRFGSLEAITDFLLAGSPAMGGDWNQVLARLNGNAEYRRQFAASYGNGPIVREQVIDALVVYQRSLATPNSRFDRYLAGDPRALSAREQNGYVLFKRYGCASCHQGMNVGGNMFQTFGVLGNYFEQRGGSLSPADLGRYNVTKAESDRHVFKVPSLRNVALTAPYFHDGSAATLPEAVEVMFRYQLGRPAPAADKADIVAFLHTLTGEYAGKPLGAQP